MTFLRIVIPLYLFDLSMISGQTLRVCPEGKPVPTFPDHALVRQNAARSSPAQPWRFRAVPGSGVAKENAAAKSSAPVTG
jgi:hypothetical protein